MQSYHVCQNSLLANEGESIYEQLKLLEIM